MPSRRRKATRIVTTAVAAAILGSTIPSIARQALPTFDVIAIHEVPSGRGTSLIASGREVQPGGRFVTQGIAVAGLILFAYDVVRPADTLLPALPDWAKTKRYAVNAAAGDTPPPSSGDERQRMRLMVREMLKDRFHLQLHTEPRQETILKMSLEPGRVRLKDVLPPASPAPTGISIGNSGGRITGTMTMATFIQNVSGLLKQQVLDETNLKGYYDMAFAWTAPPPPAGAPLPGRGLGPDGISLFITTMKDQFGLRFSAATGPVDYWVIDRLDPPTDN
jgi:uncharacterized protein (TIGR03435 family)